MLAPAADGFQVRHDLPHIARTGQRRVNEFMGFAVLGPLRLCEALEHLQISQHIGQWIVDFMRNTRRQRTNRRQVRGQLDLCVALPDVLVRLHAV